MSVFLSIIIPVYNCEKYLPKCLDSIFTLERPDLEILLVDDGSTDKSYEVCQEYALSHSCITVIQQENAGPSAARNTGLAQASGKYIAFFDSDDWIDPEHFAHTLEWVEKKDSDIWVSDFLYTTTVEDYIFQEIVEQIDETQEPISGDSYMNIFLSKYHCFWNIWRYIFKKSYLEEKKLRFAEGFHCAEDMEFLVRALTQTASIEFFHNPYYFYRINYGETLTKVFTLERIQHLLSMLKASVKTVYTSKVSYKQHMLDRLTREYVINLGVLYPELPSIQRPGARKLFWESRSLLKTSSHVLDHLIGGFIEFCGIPTTALVLIFIRKCLTAWRYIQSIANPVQVSK